MILIQCNSPLFSRWISFIKRSAANDEVCFLNSGRRRMCREAASMCRYDSS
ncbi:unnamed protein product [Brassica oleracea]